MQTLLKKVESIESEATQLVEETRKKHLSVLEDMQSREDEIIAETTAKAQARSKAIMTDVLASEEKDINAIKQQGERSIEVVHQVAEKNRPATIALVTNIIKEEYSA